MFVFQEPTERRPAPPWQLSLGGLLLVITLIAASLALIRPAPCPGFLLTMVCIPAAFRTVISIRHLMRLGERLTILEKAHEFGFSFLNVLWIELMAGFAGITISSLIYVPLALFFDANHALGASLIPGAVVGWAALSGLIWRLRPGLP
jgi:hypothetical protein